MFVLHSSKGSCVTPLSPPPDSGGKVKPHTKYVVQGHKLSEYRNRSQIWCPDSQESVQLLGNMLVWTRVFHLSGKEGTRYRDSGHTGINGNPLCSLLSSPPFQPTEVGSPGRMEGATVIKIGTRTHAPFHPR